MAIYVYESKQFSDDAVRRGVTRENIERQLVRWVEERQSIACFDRFPIPFLTKKKFADFNNRVIAAEEVLSVNGVKHQVVVLLRLVLRSSREYGRYANDPAEFAGPYLKQEQARLQPWLEDRLRACPVEALPKLTAEQHSFLVDTSAADDQEYPMVCETDDWISDTKNPAVLNHLVNLRPLVLDNPVRLVRTAHDAEELEFKQGDLRIRCRIFPGMDRVLLMRASRGSLPPRDDTPIEGDLQGVLRRSARTYSAVLLADETAWMKLERESEDSSNLALSPEEAEVLSSARNMDGKGGFPMFINGRAGSGKSTVLQYLFADTIRGWRRAFRQSDRESNIPLYLTTNAELLRKAREAVGRLLKSNAAAVAAGEQLDDATVRDITDRAFGTTAEIFRSLLPKDRQLHYSDENRITYGRFCEMWLPKFGQQPDMLRECGPQVSWHIIRSLIKGLAIDGFMECSADFEEVPKSERSVAPATFSQVFEKIWGDWYKPLCEGSGYWDEQDLAREVLDHLDGENRSICQRSHVAIFCDEAQDLTRIEIECLYRLSAFSRCELDRNSARRVRFVFAGDPFQTLNPTGFRWENMKAGFNERLGANLDKYTPAGDAIKINYRELSHNYRSSSLVVSFCNAIQCVRTHILKVDVAPQSSWSVANDSPAPSYFIETDPGVGDAMKKHQDLTIIVPCEEGDEAQFVRKSPFLNKIVTWQDGENGVPERVLSAVRAKGLEFKRILLYGFGQQTEAHRLSKLLIGELQPTVLQAEQLLPIEYFLNKFYVGASRAMRRLFVVDNKSSFETGMWHIFSDPLKLQSVVQSLPKSVRDDWKVATTTLVPGSVAAFGVETEDPLVTAADFERDGIQSRSPYMLRQAATQWRRGEKELKAFACEAQAAEWDESFERAGKLWESAGDPSRAIDACFRGAHYRTIGELVGRSAQLARSPEAKISAVLLKVDGTLLEFAALVEGLADDVSRTSIQGVFRGNMNAWKKALGDGTTRAVQQNSKRDEQGSDQVRGLVLNLRRIVDAGFPRDSLLVPLASLAVQSRDFETVLELHGQESDHPDARRARAELIFSGKRPSSGPSDSRVVALMLRERRQLAEAASWYLKAGELKEAGTSIAERLSLEGSATDHAVIAVFHELLDQLAKQVTWREMFVICRDHSLFGKRDGRIRESIKQLVVEHSIIEVKFIPLLARLEKLGNESGVGDLTSFFREFLGESVSSTNWGRWRRKVRIEHVAAALERINNLVAALRFYETALDDPQLPPAEQEFVKQRWLRCKRQQINLEVTNAAGGNRTNHVGKLKNDYEQFQVRRDVVPNEAEPTVLDVSHMPIEPPPPPPLGAVIEFVAPPTHGRDKLVDDGYLFFEDAAQARVRMTDKSDGDRITIGTSAPRVQSDDVEIVKTPDNPDRWEAPSRGIEFVYSASSIRIAWGGQERTFLRTNQVHSGPQTPRSNGARRDALQRISASTEIVRLDGADAVGECATLPQHWRDSYEVVELYSACGKLIQGVLLRERQEGRYTWGSTLAGPDGVKSVFMDCPQFSDSVDEMRKYLLGGFPLLIVALKTQLKPNVDRSHKQHLRGRGKRNR